MLRQDDAVKAYLVLECFRQGLGFGHQATLMVLGCLANRQRMGWGAWLDVLKNAPKFSATLEQPNRDTWPDLWNPEFIKLLHAVDGVYDGSIPNPALEGIFWADLSKGKAGITNPWFVEKVLNSPAHAICANQNSFTLFR